MDKHKLETHTRGYRRTFLYFVGRDVVARIRRTRQDNKADVLELVRPLWARGLVQVDRAAYLAARAKLD